jgi:acyl carrier protein
MTDFIPTRVKQVLVDILDLNLAPDDIGDRVPLYSSFIGLDSLTLLRIITELERVFSCEIDDEAVMITDLVDVGSLVDLVSAQLPQGAVALPGPVAPRGEEVHR